MNYKTLIAFLGKNQMKDWATPKSEFDIPKYSYNGVSGNLDAVIIYKQVIEEAKQCVGWKLDYDCNVFAHETYKGDIGKVIVESTDGPILDFVGFMGSKMRLYYGSHIAFNHNDKIVTVTTNK